MPRESYAVTVTFKSYFKLQTRLERCQHIWSRFYTNINHQKDWTFVWSIEYHKYHLKHWKAGQDNPMAPHVHGILQVPEGLTQRELTNIFQDINKSCGRTFIDLLPTQEDFDKWYIYIQKDVEKNNTQYPPLQHWMTYEHRYDPKDYNLE